LFEKVIIIGNPIAGGGAEKKILEAFDILNQKGYRVELHFTTKKGDAEDLAKKFSGMPSNLIIAAGGDGTYNEVANGLVKSSTPMAILPVGTTSVLAKELKMPYKISKSIDFILNGKIRKINTGFIKLSRDEKDSQIERHFLLMAGIGFDGEAVFGVNKQIKRLTGKGGYILSGLGAALRYNPILLNIKAYDAEIIKKCHSCDFDYDYSNNSISLDGYAVIIGKAACYGGNLKITPDAKLTVPFFYIFIAHSRSRFSLFRYLVGVATKTLLKYKDISYLKAARLEVLGSSRVQIDGDYAGTAPASMEVVPDSLDLIVNDY
jgi:YegS/Rv2252/BmrU family lipid kinase